MLNIMTFSVSYMWEKTCLLVTFQGRLVNNFKGWVVLIFGYLRILKSK